MAIQAAKTAVMAIREADAGLRSGTDTASLREEQRQRHGGPALKQQSFNWNAPYKY